MEMTWQEPPGEKYILIVDNICPSTVGSEKYVTSPVSDIFRLNHVVKIRSCYF